MATRTCSAGDDDGFVEAFYRLRDSRGLGSGDGHVVDGFENACVGVESAEVIDIVGFRKLAVTISDKFVKIGSLFWGESKSGATKVVDGCKGVNGRKGRAQKKGRPLEASDWRERTKLFSISEKVTVTRDRDRPRERIKDKR